MKLKNIILSAALMMTTAASAQNEDKYQVWGPTNAVSQTGVILRAGYVIGGTTPLPVPSEIRSINEFKPLGGVTLGADFYHMFNRHWGLQFGWHLFYEGFHTGADVKNYRMGITKDGNYLDGNFTGTDITDTKMFGSTIPFTATYRISPRWNISAGPFVSLLYYKTFEGEVYNGYLREGSPVGQKIEITEDNPATYDFKDDMLSWYWGMQLLFDWKAMRHMNVFAGVDWSCSSIFPGDFETVEFKMFPIYAKIGIAYRY